MNEFSVLTKQQLQSHFEKGIYGDFVLTEAIRPSYNVDIIPKQGFRQELRYFPEMNAKVPTIHASVSREILLETFLDVLNLLGPDEVSVYLMNTLQEDNQIVEEFYREDIDLPVLKSILIDYEDLLLNDGGTGIAVGLFNSGNEVVLDEHKIIRVFCPKLADLDNYAKFLESSGVHEDVNMKFLFEAEHMHIFHPRHNERFEDLKLSINAEKEEI